MITTKLDYSLTIEKYESLNMKEKCVYVYVV